MPLRHDGDPLPGSPSPPIILWSAHGRVGRGLRKITCDLLKPSRVSKVATIHA
jgi:hypothetical protein